MRRNAWCAIVLFAIACLTPATTLAAEKIVTSVEQLAGPWYGWQRNRSGYDIRANVVIQRNGRVEVYFENNPAMYAILSMDNGVLRIGDDARQWGTARLSEERGTEYLTLIRADGSVWVECERRVR